MVGRKKRKQRPGRGKEQQIKPDEIMGVSAKNEQKERTKERNMAIKEAGMGGESDEEHDGSTAWLMMVQTEDEAAGINPLHLQKKRAQGLSMRRWLHNTHTGGRHQQRRMAAWLGEAVHVGRSWRTNA